MTINIDELTIGQLKQIHAMSSCAGATVPKCPSSGRAVVVVDRGWIFAGDMSVTADGYLRLSNAVHVFKWDSLGFAKMLENWKSSSVDLRPVADVELPMDAIVFRVPVASDWGKK